METRFDVVVVGGGLAGLSLAFGLADRLHSVAVLEARKDIKPVKRGLTLSPNGLDALDKLGLLNDVEKIGHKVRLVKFFEGNGELLAAYDYSLLDHKHNYIMTFLPHELELVLRQRALEKGVKILEGASFEGLLRENGRLTGVRANFAGSARDFGSNVIVGADGVMSRVRESLGIKAEVKKYNQSYVVTVADALDDSSEEARHYLAKGKMLGIFPLTSGSYLFSYLPVGAFESAKALGLDHFKKSLTALAPDLAKPLMKVSWEDFQYMVPQRLKAASWVSDQVALVGDAVHSLEPSLGQGANLTLQDLLTLLEVLDECFARSDFSAKVLKAYETARRPQANFMQTMAERAALYMNTDNVAIEWLRNRSLKKAQKNRELMLLAMKMASGMVDGLGIGQVLKLAGIL